VFSGHSGGRGTPDRERRRPARLASIDFEPAEEQALPVETVQRFTATEIRLSARDAAEALALGAILAGANPTTSKPRCPRPKHPADQSAHRGAADSRLSFEHAAL